LKNIIIAAGGTGGHISPGVALIEYLIANKNKLGLENIYIHTLLRNKDNPDIKEISTEILWHNIPQFNKMFPFYIFHYTYYILKTFFQFYSRKIDCVIAMGGYSCIPSLLYAIVFRKNIFLCEQNRIPGKVVRTFLKYSKKISYTIPPTEAFLTNTDVISKINGNPLRIKIIPDIKVIREKKNKDLKPEDKINILVMGGSQGARQINNMVLATLNNLEINKHFKFRVLTGTNLYEEAKNKSNNTVDLISYSQDMKTHYEWANLVIARSCAGVLSECSVHGLPMILIPYPFAADNHQFENAKYYEENYGAKVLYKKNDDNTELILILLKISSEKNLLSDMTKRILQAAKPDAAKETIEFFFNGN
jgi:UDP-N-acetylglucosamine--N-acetylmuramyl-(pentapeptide) pyrophosphoryl-undecaprenol N-acetylglucosamine transferase